MAKDVVDFVTRNNVAKSALHQLACSVTLGFAQSSASERGALHRRRPELTLRALFCAPPVRTEGAAAGLLLCYNAVAASPD